MKRQNRSLLFIAIVIIAISCFFVVDFNATEAGIFNIPKITNVENKTVDRDAPINTLADINGALTQIVDETVPSVVTVRVKEKVTIQRRQLPRMFQQFFGGQAYSQPQQRVRQGLGSGVVISKDGYILTNNHVVAGADDILVTLHNGREYKGEVVGRDPLTDIAVVKIDADNLNPLPIGDSDNVKVGEMVLAIGSPLEDKLAQSVTFGIVSAKGRTIGNGSSYNYYIQTDAAINPGNSGGALVNMSGQLIGINSAIISKTGGYQGIGLAIPSNIAKSVMNSLIDNGKVERGYLGIQYGGDVDATMAQALNVDISNGIIVGTVEEGSPADEAGLQENDIIYKINDNTINSWAELRVIVGTSKPGDELKLGVVHDGERTTVNVTLGENEQIAALNDQDSGGEDLSENLGFQVDNLGAEIAQRLGLQSSQPGVIVTDVERASAAFRQGLRSHDIIVSVSNETVANTSDFINAIRDIEESGTQVVLLKVLRAGKVQGDIVVSKQYIAFKL